MEKDFDKWNYLKKEIDSRKNISVYVHAREIWWCNLGLNIGTETNGKNDMFERPCLVVRVYNKESILILPITSLEKSDNFHFEIEIKNKDGTSKKVYVKLTQARVVNIKRMIRKVDILSKDKFKELKEKLIDYI